MSYKYKEEKDIICINIDSKISLKCYINIKY